MIYDLYGTSINLSWNLHQGSRRTLVLNGIRAIDKSTISGWEKVFASNDFLSGNKKMLSPRKRGREKPINRHSVCDIENLIRLYSDFVVAEFDFSIDGSSRNKNSNQ